MKAQDFWGNPRSSEWWVGEDARYERTGANASSQEYLREHVPTDIRTICEVGAGTGRLIGMFNEFEAHSVDINPGLCKVVKQKYPFVNTHNCSASQIALPDNSINLVYTYQMLQHVPNEDIEQVLTELLRITNDRLWLMEGLKENKEQGERTHRANGGSFIYYYDKVFKCEEIYDLITDKVRVYKIRKQDNPNFRIELGVF